MKHFSRSARTAFVALAVLALLAVGSDRHATAQGGAKTFETPEKAAEALIDAAKKKDVDALLAVLGPATKEWIISGDKVQDKQARMKFVTAYERKHAIERDGRDKAILVVGDDGYPFAFPIVKTAAGWAFDPEQGREEILNRRIGENELTTIQVLRAIADAQHDYARVDRNGDGLLEYAAKFLSSEGKRDGLYWPTAKGDQPSPLGLLVVRATAEGYKPGAGAPNDETNAFHGYRFKLLKKQGPNAPGGRYDYVVDGKMIGGFAVLAYPAKYGASGVMSFAINQDGDVYETDLGPKTEAKAKAIDSFDPGSDWKKVKPE